MSASKGPVQSIRYWTPRFTQGGDFIASSLPANRRNTVYEIRGMVVSTGTINGYTVSNGDIAVFNSSGNMIEILGDSSEQGGGGGGGGGGAAFAGFLETWTPANLPGITLTFTADVGAFEDLDNPLEYSEDGYTISQTQTSYGNGTSGGSVTGEVFEAGTFNVKSGVYFKFSDPDDVPNGGNSFIGLVDNNLSIEGMPDSFLGFYIGIADAINLYAIGDFVHENGSATFLNPPLDMAWTANTEYCLAYDNTAGSYGTLYLYSSDTPNAPIAEHVLTLAYADPTQFLAGIDLDTDEYGSVNSTMSVTIVNEPTVAITGVTNIGGGGSFDVASLPADREGMAFTVANQVGNVVYPDVGLLMNGDLTFFNSAGDLTGVLMGRSSLVTTGVDLVTVQALVDAIKNDIGSVPLTPTFTTSAMSEQLVGSLAAGYGQVTVNTNWQRTLYSGGAGLSTYSNLCVIGYTDGINTTPPTTIEGVHFKLPNPSNYNYANNSTNNRLIIGIGEDYQGNPSLSGDHWMKISIDMPDYGSTSYPYQGSYGSLSANGIGDGQYGTPTYQTTGITGVTLDYMHDYFIGYSDTQIIFMNTTTSESAIIYSSLYQSSGVKRFIYAYQDQSNTANEVTGNIVAEIIYPQPTTPYPFFSGVVTSDYGVSTDIVGRANKSFEIAGLTGIKYLDSWEIDNGNIVLFNSDGAIVAVL